MQKLKNIFSLLVLLLLLSINLIAQKESMIWYFGRNLGFDFHTNPPTQLYNANSNFEGYIGSATICDPQGNLKFYSDGKKVFNKNHQIMKNGNGLLGNSINHSARTLIIPRPNNPGLYYIITLSYQWPAKLQYSEVDMNKDNGLGEVVSKKNFLMDSASFQLTAVKHSNGQSLWLLTSSFTSSVHYAFEINSSGIQAPVLSKCSNFISPNGIVGNMKLSPDNKFLVSSSYMTLKGGSLQFFKFNATTGEIKYDFGIFDNEEYYGVEFSPDISKLYVTTVGRPLPGDLIWQFDLKAGDSTSIKNSKTYIGRSFNLGIIGGCQLAIDGKIYIANNGTHIGRINNPNEKGNKCNYNSTCFPGFKPIDGVTSLMGYDFPDFIQSYFFIPDFTAQNTCFGDSTFFSLTDSAYIDSVLWCFDDSLSGQSNFSKINTPYHIFSDTGLYNVSVVVYHDTAKADTLLREIRISPYPSAAFFINDSSQCFNGNVFQFTDTSSIVSGSFNWEWDFGDSNRLFVQNPVHSYSQADTFEVRLTVLSDYGCKSSVSKNVYVLPSPRASISINDTAQCFNQNSFTFSNPWGYQNPKGLKVWHFGDSQTSNSDTASHSYASADTFQVTLVEETDLGCRDTAIKNVIVHPSPQANFSFNDSVQCFNEQVLVAGNSSLVARDSIIENKWVVNSDTVVGKDFTNYAFDSNGVYQVQLIVTTSNSCPDTIEKQMEILPSPKASISINDTAQCFFQNSFTFSNPWGFQNPKGSKMWDFGNGSASNTDTAIYSYASADTFRVILIEETGLGCRDTAIRNVIVHPMPKAVFSFNDSVQCFNEQELVAGNLSLVARDLIIENKWILNSDTVLSKDLENYTFDKYGNYPIKLIVTTKNDCKDTFTSNFLLHPSPLAKFVLDDSVQCFNEQSLEARNSSLVVGDSITEYQWFLDNQFLGISGSPVLPVIQPGTSELTLSLPQPPTTAPTRLHIPSSYILHHLLTLQSTTPPNASNRIPLISPTFPPSNPAPWITSGM
jgi:PKD repeat protein